MNSKADRYISALRYRWLTRFYDPVVALTTREKIFKRKLLALVASTHPAKVLDLACGTGTLARMIRLDCPDSAVHGLDGDPEILELARGKSRREGLDIHFDRGMSYAMPYPDRTFDVTRDNIQGRLPGLFATAGFKQVEVAERISTVLGTLDLITAFNAEAESQHRKYQL